MTVIPEYTEGPFGQIESEKEYRHNWLYSVVPALADGAIILAGYCKICDQAFSRQIPWSENIDKTTVTKMNIPKFGCIAQTMP